jgi:putative hemolysin
VVADSPHSRFPVTDDRDEVTGIVHVRDLFSASLQDSARPVAEVTRPVLAVGELLAVPALWRRLRDEERHVAIVVNEYGSVAGMVTLEDALEQILGEVQDEFDHEEPPIAVDGRRVTVRGDVLIDVLNERFELSLDPGRVDTVGGWVWHQLGRMPEVGDAVTLDDGIVLDVEAMEGRAVDRASFELPGGEA